jgi:metallo-beta-lactamase family protein
MKIAFLGAARTVTGSQHLIRVNGSSILLDCGLYQGAPREAYERNHSFGFEPDQLDAVLLSHAHIDHCGNLPNLVKQGFDGRIFCTTGTAHLADLLLRDSGHIQEQEAEEPGAGREKAAAQHEPLYTREEAARVQPYFEKVAYEATFEVVPGVRATFFNAGHILGSAAVQLEVEENGKTRRLWFSGDIGRRNLPLIKDPVLPRDVDTLIMESTYGDRVHGDPLEAYDQLREVLVRTIERKGRVIIPAFAVGRTQEIVYDIHQMMEREEIPSVPVFVDSPLAVEASQIFIEHPEYFDEEARNFVASADSRTALGFERLTYIESAQESRLLNERDGPMIIISTSGMLETGRILHHVRFAIEDPRNTILLVSYQAPGTLGRALANGEEQVEIFGRLYQRKAEVVMLSGLSAHAGQEFLLEYACAVREQVKQVFLVHGEEKPAETLQEMLRGAGFEKTYLPYARQIMEI